MKHSVDRILTTHAGSLPRPDDWLAMMMERDKTGKTDAAAYVARNRQAVSDIVKKQLALGSPWAGSREVKAFPEYYEAMARAGGGPGAATRMICTAPITYKGQASLQN